MAKKKSQNVQEQLEPKTENQKRYFDAIENSTITICTGPPGTGKTFVACGIAARKLMAGEIYKIIIARPLVTCGVKNIGIMPGELDNKISPYMRPLLDAFEDFISPMNLNGYLRNHTIEMLPLELMRGVNLRNAFIICDEAQNAEFAQLKMLLTRFSFGSKVILTGDPSQSDIGGATNSLTRVSRKLRGHKKISIVHLDRTDILRHPMIQWIDERLNEPDESPIQVYMEPEWLEGKCLGCNTDFLYPETDEKNRDTVQVQCYNCNEIWWTPFQTDEGFEEGGFRFKDCQRTRRV